MLGVAPGLAMIRADDLLSGSRSLDADHTYARRASASSSRPRIPARPVFERRRPARRAASLRALLVGCPWRQDHS